MNPPKAMRRMRVLATAAAAWLTTVAAADIIWFDETNASRGFRTFAELCASYDGFVGTGNTTLSFAQLPEGTQLKNQYAAHWGVRFRNTADGQYAWASGVHPEGGPYVEDLTGYDGSYMPDGKSVYLKYDNHLADTPLTILFDRPVARVGAFLAVGKEGTVHSLTISAYDSAQHLVGRKVVDSWLWDGTSSRQNFETFFALRTGAPSVKRVEILNNSDADFSNALVLDNVMFNTCVPEPGACALLGLAAAVSWRRRSCRETSPE